MAVSEINDAELGTVRIRYNALATRISFRRTPKGELVATAPKGTPGFAIKQAIRLSRGNIRRLLEQIPSTHYADGQEIGKSHRLAVVPTTGSTTHVQVRERAIIAELPAGSSLEETAVQDEIRRHVIKILQKEAKAYLPRRLAILARRLDYHYQRVRFSHASSRWGSCSTAGTISLNIALMNLPLELIDYVLVHELCHTRHMDHSRAFWAAVEQGDPHYKLHRAQLKAYSPHV